jgi:hypothetical protein
LYATAIHGVSVTELQEREREGVFLVVAKVANKTGRTDVSTGAVSIGGLKGEHLANALMKAETKAKRRATLSICGLGFLDGETELGEISGATRSPLNDELDRMPADVSPVFETIEAVPFPQRGKASRQQERERQEKEQDAIKDKAYRESLKKIPDAKTSSDPWGGVRSTEAPKTAAPAKPKTKTGSTAN